LKRSVQPEWLDELPAEDPAALRSRRDLNRLNRIMGHVGAMRDLLQSATRKQSFRRIVEIGAGDGTFALRLAGEISSLCKPQEWVLVDSKNAVKEETRRGLAALGWKTEVVVADVFDWLRNCRPALADAMITNLFLHQFPDKSLAEMLELASRKTQSFAACEPRRSALPLAFSRMTGLIGCNAVTRNDAPLSVRAGFAGKELSALWPRTAHFRWRVEEGSARWFSHTFLAAREDG
jgi:hypothetical protein